MRGEPRARSFADMQVHQQAEDTMKASALQAISDAAQVLDTVFDHQIAPEIISVRAFCVWLT
jgi:hypothetical protein